MGTVPGGHRTRRRHPRGHGRRARRSHGTERERQVDARARIVRPRSPLVRCGPRRRARRPAPRAAVVGRTPSPRRGRRAPTAQPRARPQHARERGVAAELDGWRKTDARAAAHNTLHEAGADDLAELLSPAFSLGEQQRVAVARAIVGNSPLVLADEPSCSARQRPAAETVVQLLSDLAHTGRAVLLVTHDSRLAS